MIKALHRKVVAQKLQEILDEIGKEISEGEDNDRINS